MKDQELLSAYRDGELPPDPVRKVEECLAADPRFREEQLRLQQAASILRVECEPDPGFLVRHRERREDLSPVRLWTWRQLGYRMSAAAAALLVAAGLSVWQAGQPEAGPSANRQFRGGPIGCVHSPSRLPTGPVARVAARRRKRCAAGCRSSLNTRAPRR